jgi:hypothetical protein
VNTTLCKTFNTLPNGQQSASMCEEGYSAVNSEYNIQSFILLVFPIIVLSLIFAISIGSQGEGSPLLFIVGGIIGVVVAVGLNSVGYAAAFTFMGGYSNIPNQVPASTSTTSTTISSSTSTTIIPLYTGCTTDPSIQNYMPLKCCNLTPVAPSYIAFNLTLNATKAIYNINLACTTQAWNPPANQFYPLQANGMPNLNGDTNGTSLSLGKFIQVRKWPCKVNSTLRSFHGYVWINFTMNPGSPNTFNNQWERNRTFIVSANLTLPNITIYNQVINMTCR